MKRTYAFFARMMTSKRRIITFANSSTNLLTLSRFSLRTLARREAKTWLTALTGLLGYFNWPPETNKRRTR